MDLNRMMAGNNKQQKVYQMTFFSDPHHALDRMMISAEWSLLEFLEEYREALLSAGDLVGGKDGVSLVQGLYDDISTNGLAAHGVRRRLAAFMALLSFQIVGASGRAEYVCFDEINLLDSRTGDIRFLNGRLANLRAAIVAKRAQDTAPLIE
ncbi:hypothetical protein R3X27_12080 [Tropicimonas sp. TH_r6]|uniref:hypothetical protein n=1 Tax=Tropicimonas sp. TH_r6 TaxID=3082085 RepID=UPI00295453E6|nr:hypothetical protein [Tropicimonas sp. TH_r6]MDV7143421.1 hypothetical protein [Tropicimonas sp. TH_r6]